MKNKIYLIPLISIPLLILLVGVLTLIFPRQKDYVLFYPEDFSSKIGSEVRRLPSYKNKEEAIDFFTEEILLGPVDLGLEPISLATTQVNSTLLRQKVLYIDLSKEFFLDNSKIKSPLGIRLDYLKRNILYNFPKIKEVRITLEGQSPELAYTKE